MKYRCDALVRHNRDALLGQVPSVYKRRGVCEAEEARIELAMPGQRHSGL